MSNLSTNITFENISSIPTINIIPKINSSIIITNPINNTSDEMLNITNNENNAHSSSELNTSPPIVNETYSPHSSDIVNITLTEKTIIATDTFINKTFNSINTQNTSFIHKNESSLINETSYNIPENTTIKENYNEIIIKKNNDTKNDDNNIIISKSSNINRNKSNNPTIFSNHKNITIPFLNKSIETHFLLVYGVPLLTILLVVFILFCYFVKRRKRIKSLNINENENEANKPENSGFKSSYKKLQNTSNINVGLNQNNMSMSEIKVQNLKEEIHNIISSNSGGSNSSGKRKREKRKSLNKNNAEYIAQEGDKGIQNEIKEQIKKYVIDEQYND